MSKQTASILAIGNADEIASRILRLSFMGAPGYQFKPLLSREGQTWQVREIQDIICKHANVSGIPKVMATENGEIMAGTLMHGSDVHIVLIIEGDVAVYTKNAVPDTQNWHLSYTSAHFKRKFALIPNAVKEIERGQQQYHDECMANSCENIARQALESMRKSYEYGLGMAENMAHAVKRGDMTIEEMIANLAAAQVNTAVNTETVYAEQPSRTM